MKAISKSKSRAQKKRPRGKREGKSETSNHNLNLVFEICRQSSSSIRTFVICASSARVLCDPRRGRTTRMLPREHAEAKKPRKQHRECEIEGEKKRYHHTIAPQSPHGSHGKTLRIKFEETWVKEEGRRTSYCPSEPS